MNTSIATHAQAPGIPTALELDLKTIARILCIIRSARLDLQSAEDQVKARARVHLLSALGYMTGYFDASGYRSAPHPGLVALFPEVHEPQAADAALDLLEENLSKLLDETPSRLAIAGGLMLIGACVILAGVAIKWAGGGFD